MSGVLKGIGKVFKKVAKFIKKILPIILIAAAVIISAGMLAPVAVAGAGVVAAGGAAAGATAAGVGATAVGATAAGIGTAGAFGATTALGTSLAATAGGALTTGAVAGGVAAAGSGFATIGSMLSGALTTMLSSETIVGAAISAVGSGIQSKMEANDKKKALNNANDRADAKYAGVGQSGYGGSPVVKPGQSTDPYASNSFGSQGLGAGQDAMQGELATAAGPGAEMTPNAAAPSDPNTLTAQSPSAPPPTNARPSVTQTMASGPAAPRYRYNPQRGGIDYA